MKFIPLQFRLRGMNHFFLCKQMDSREFALFFETYYYVLCAYATQYVGESDAHEIVQDLMVWYWVNHHRLELEGPVKPYLMRAVKNRALNLLTRRHTKSRVVEDLKYTQPYFEDPDCYVAADCSQRIQEALEAMPREWRAVFERSRFQNQTYADIAQALHISIPTVNYRMMQALRLLRVALEDFLFVILLCHFGW